MSVENDSLISVKVVFYSTLRKVAQQDEVEVKIEDKIFYLCSFATSRVPVILLYDCIPRLGHASCEDLLSRRFQHQEL